MIALGPFSLEEETQQLRHGGLERPLRAKSFTVLRELVRRRGRLVTKEDLFRACWPNTAVSQTVLRVCISEIRAVLAEDVTGGEGAVWTGHLTIDGHVNEETGRSWLRALKAALARRK